MDVHAQVVNEMTDTGTGSVRREKQLCFSPCCELFHGSKFQALNR